MADDELNEVKRRKPAARAAKTPPVEPVAMANSVKPISRRAKVAPADVATTPKPARKPAASRAAARKIEPARVTPIVDAPAAAAAPTATVAPLPAATTDEGEKLGFGHYRAGKHGDAGSGWLPGALAVAAALLVLGFVA